MKADHLISHFLIQEQTPGSLGYWKRVRDSATRDIGGKFETLLKRVKAAFTDRDLKLLAVKELLSIDELIQEYDDLIPKLSSTVRKLIKVYASKEKLQSAGIRKAMLTTRTYDYDT